MHPLTTQTIARSLHAHHDQSFFAYRPHCVDRAAHLFVSSFDAQCLYAVKTNPDPVVIQRLHRAGIRQFDVASLEEIALVHRLFPDASLYFMHPVKSRRAISVAYHRYGVRHFSLDSYDELEKIKQETGYARDLRLHVRLAIPNNFAEMALAGKFGATLQEAPALIRATADVAEQTGVCFHAGSQCMHPEAYRIAMRMTNTIIVESGVKVQYFNVGGGFPSVYPGMTPPDMTEFFHAIHEEFANVAGYEQMQLLAEPGRALVAECMSLIVQVQLRKDNMLYINDGTYGSLFDAGTPHFIFPTRMVGASDAAQTDAAHLSAFTFYGPTCDSLDVMTGPFYLPDSIREGDYIEVGQMGAYSRYLATRFNGFTAHPEMLIVDDEPLMSMYAHVTLLPKIYCALHKKEPGKSPQL